MGIITTALRVKKKGVVNLDMDNSPKLPSCNIRFNLTDRKTLQSYKLYYFNKQ